MASSWTHAATALATAATIMPQGTHRRAWTLTMLAAVVPDIDAIGRPFGLGDVAFLGGHRAITHSFAFAAAAAVILLTALRPLPRQQLIAWLALAMAIATHGMLDAMTSYGEGVAFLAPFSDVRYRAPWLLLGDGIVRDTIAFLAFLALARFVLTVRGFSVPRPLQWLVQGRRR